MVDVQRAEEIYECIKGKLKGEEGKIIAIETDSGDYFIGEDVSEACDKGRTKYPSKQFFFMRVGTGPVYHVLTPFHLRYL